jgi:hypothetical protein
MLICQVASSKLFSLMQLKKLHNAYTYLFFLSIQRPYLHCIANLQTIKCNHVIVTIDKHMDRTRNVMRPNFFF